MEGLKSQPSERELEAQIQELLNNSRVPDEIVERWEKEYGTRSRQEQLAALKERIERRRNVITKSRSISPENVEVHGDTPEAVRQMISRIAKGEYESIGQGKSGKVIASVRNREICYKVFFPDEHQPSGTNDVVVELEFQRQIAALGEVAGVRAPETKFLIENNNVRAIAMERLDADSLEDVLHYRAQLPAVFNVYRFFSALKTYIQALHEKGFYHRDLHAGNVLVDRQTGMPYVIDFGHATRSIGDEGVYREEIIRSGRQETIVLLSDEEAPKQLEIKIGAFLRKQETS